MGAEPRPAGAPAPAAQSHQAPASSPPAAAPDPAPLPQHVIRRTRTGGLWAAVACFAVVLLLLLIFILQNGRTVEVSYLGAHGHLPLGVALLLAAVSGVLLVALAGTARILQLRRTARRHRRADTRHLAAAPAQRQAAAQPDSTGPAGQQAGTSPPAP